MNDNDSRYRAYLQGEKWQRIAKRRMEIDGYKCCGCGSCGTSQNPLEVHHLSYRSLYNEESRVYEDLVTLCRSCHKNLHKIMERTTSQTGRKGWKDARIPQIHVFTVSGTDTQMVIEKGRDKQ